MCLRVCVCVCEITVQIDEHYEPAAMELRTVFGLQFSQQRNDAVIDNKLFTNIVTTRKHVNCCHLQFLVFVRFYTVGCQVTRMAVLVR